MKSDHARTDLPTCQSPMSRAKENANPTVHLAQTVSQAHNSVASRLATPSPPPARLQDARHVVPDRLDDQDFVEDIDALDVFGAGRGRLLHRRICSTHARPRPEMIRHLNDPEHPLSLEQLKVAQVRRHWRASRRIARLEPCGHSHARLCCVFLCMHSWRTFMSTTPTTTCTSTSRRPFRTAPWPPSSACPSG